MGLNRILDLLGLPTLAHQDSCMQLFYCWVCTCCFMTLDPGPLWLSKSFFRLASDLCLGKERMEMSQSLCPALVLLWCYNMAYNFSDNPSLDIASLSMVHALSKSRIFSVFHENTMWHHFPACSGICNECQLSLIVKVACGALMRGSKTWHISMLFPQLLFKNNLHIYNLWFCNWNWQLIWQNQWFFTLSKLFWVWIWLLGCFAIMVFQSSTA